jgi:hypothetical protein
MTWDKGKKEEFRKKYLSLHCKQKTSIFKDYQYVIKEQETFR